MADANSSHQHDDHDHQHAHGHQHQHHDANAVDVAKLNEEHYDAVAEKYESIPEVVNLCRKIGFEFLKTYEFDEKSTSVLDFACGTGLVSRELVPHSKKILGVDISQGAVNFYNKRFAQRGLSPDVVRAVRAELTGADGELDGQKFDAITCSMAYHHFASPASMTRILAGLLKPDGILIISDRIKTPTSHIPPSSMPAGMPEVPEASIPHGAGFEETAVREMFEGAGLQTVEFRHALSETFLGVTMEIFIANGVKASE